MTPVANSVIMHAMLILKPLIQVLLSDELNNSP